MRKKRENGLTRYFSRFFEKISLFWNTWVKFRSSLAKYSWHIFFSLVSSFAYVILGMLEPWPLKLIFDNIFLNEPLPQHLKALSFYFGESKFLMIECFVGIMIIIIVLRTAFYYYWQRFTAFTGQKIASEVRINLYDHLQHLCLRFHDKRKTGDMLSRLTTDIQILKSTLVATPLAIVTDLLFIFSMVFIMGWMDIELTIMALMAIPLMLLLMKKYRVPLKKAMKIQREKESHLANLAFEGLTAIKVVQGFQRQSYEVSRFGAQNKNSLSKGLKATRLEAKLNAVSEFSIAVITALILGIAGKRVLGGLISPGDLLVFAYYLRAFNRPFKRIARTTEQLSRMTASWGRIADLMNIKPEVKESSKAKIAPKFKGEICYKNVCFGYHSKKPLLKNFNLTILSGEKVAISGKSGAGKSSLVNLLPRFYDCSSGKILIDGIDIRTWSLKSLRKQISVIFQEPILFSTTILGNIAYGSPHATEQEVIEIAKKLTIHEMITSLPQGYRTIAGDAGCTLSGGQKQCVAIARAVIKNAPIIILDEPTSSLDPVSSDLVMQAIHALIAGKTALLISHEEKLLNQMDRVYNID